jgi:hypothetical protein
LHELELLGEVELELGLSVEVEILVMEEEKGPSVYQGRKSNG